MRKYWLLKTEPGCYSIDDIAKEKKTLWTGIRNYQARNFIRDEMQPGDLAFFYHSNATPPGIAGVVEITGRAEPDPTARDTKDEHFDSKATDQNPLWFAVPVIFKKKYKELITLDQIKFNPKLKGIVVAQKGSRLSVQPVSEQHFNVIDAL